MYGSGYIAGMPIYINNPFSSTASNLMRDANAIVSAYQRLIDGGLEIRYKLFPQKGGLFPWGRTGNGDYLNWHAIGNPEKWDVVVWDSGEAEFKEFRGKNFSGFLADVLEGTINVFPRIFFDPPPAFVVDRP
jgi:hypothetical protein